jgi:uncharacterized lipoprotein YajG
MAPVLAAALVMSGCGDDPFEVPTNPTPAVPVTETFNGTVSLKGAQTHTFTTQASGTVTATLKFLVPDNMVKMGFALGTYNGSACQLVITKTDAVEATVITGAVSALGSLCVYIHDVGNLVQPADYEIEVVHP